ncbi:MAG: hypothetical protein E6J82_03845 [Deltaproteobacteria bacterium]|nr:MAG: hypothetical protein E6J82_03845 [Deltaproteobacteria bacterium]
MNPARLFVWTAAMVVAAFVVPQGAPLLGMDLAGRVWNGLRLTLPFLSQTGDVIAGAMGGVVVGFFQWLALKDASVRWLTIVAAPAAGAIAGLFQAPWNPRWPRAQALAAAWAALGAMLPFPRWAAAAFMVGAAVISAWGIAGSGPRRIPSSRGTV